MVAVLAAIESLPVVTPLAHGADAEPRSMQAAV
jgi:hypothetical protein